LPAFFFLTAFAVILKTSGFPLRVAGRLRILPAFQAVRTDPQYFRKPTRFHGIRR
jgi:hypothetical protein